MLRSWCLKVVGVKKWSSGQISRLISMYKGAHQRLCHTHKISWIVSTNNYQNMIFLRVVACEIGRNTYFAGTDQRTVSGVWWELWVICCTNSDPWEIWISLGSAFFVYFFFVNFSLSLHGVVALAYGLENTFPRSQRVLGFRIQQVPSVFFFPLTSF